MSESSRVVQRIIQASSATDTLYPAIAQIVHIVKPLGYAESNDSFLVTSASPAHELALTNRLSAKFSSCISFSNASITYGEEVSDSETDPASRAAISLRRATYGALVSMDVHGRNVKMRHPEVRRAYRYTFLWYTPLDGLALPDTFPPSNIPTWLEIGHILHKTGIHLSIISPDWAGDLSDVFNGLLCEEVSPNIVFGAVPDLPQAFRVFEFTLLPGLSPLALPRALSLQGPKMEHADTSATSSGTAEKKSIRPLLAQPVAELRHPLQRHLHPRRQYHRASPPDRHQLQPFERSLSPFKNRRDTQFTHSSHPCTSETISTVRVDPVLPTAAIAVSPILAEAPMQLQHRATPAEHEPTAFITYVQPRQTIPKPAISAHTSPSIQPHPPMTGSNSLQPVTPLAWNVHTSSPSGDPPIGSRKRKASTQGQLRPSQRASTRPSKRTKVQPNIIPSPSGDTPLAARYAVKMEPSDVAEYVLNSAEKITGCMAGEPNVTESTRDQIEVFSVMSLPKQGLYTGSCLDGALGSPS